MSRHYLDWHDGWLCVVSEHIDTNSPTLERNYWPVQQCTRAQAEAKNFIGARCERTPVVGRYTADIPPSEQDVGLSEPVKLPGYRLTLDLDQGGQTRMIRCENVPIPCPKVRKGIKTRWYNGRWQKYLKLEGWVSA